MPVQETGGAGMSDIKSTVTNLYSWIKEFITIINYVCSRTIYNFVMTMKITVIMWEKF